MPLSEWKWKMVEISENNAWDEGDALEHGALPHGAAASAGQPQSPPGAGTWSAPGPSKHSQL